MIILGVIIALVSMVIAAPQDLSRTFSNQFGLLKANFCPEISRAFKIKVTGGDDWCTELAPWYGVLEIKEDSLEDRIAVQCGASLVGTKHLVTAAHCVWYNDGNTNVCSEDLTAEQCNQRPECKRACLRVPADQLLVYLGVTNLDTKPKPQPLSVSKITLHPGWNLTSPDNDVLEGHDIAVLELAQSLELNIVNPQTNIWPVSLPDSSHESLIEEGVRLEVNGHGLNDSRSGPVSILQHGDLEVSSKLDCRERWGDIGDQVCAVGRNDKGRRVDSCHGDSGSGLVATHHDRKVLVGVVSGGQSRCEFDTGDSSLYTNVLSHIQWIKEIVVGDSIPEPQTSNTTLIMSAKKTVGNKMLTSLSVHTAPITPGSDSLVFPKFPFPISDLIPLYRVGQARAGFCGGRNENTEKYQTACFTLGPESWIEDSVELSVVREESASSQHQDGTVVLGGLVDGRETRSVEVLVGKTSVPGPNMRVARSLACAVSVGNSVIVTGGYLGFETLSDVEECEVEAKIQVTAASVVTIRSSLGQCKSVRSMNQPRFNHACLSIPTVDDYIVLVAGGETWEGGLTSVEQYSRSHNSWRTLSPLPEDRTGAALVYSLGSPRLLGGYSEARGGPTDTIYSLNMETQEWEEDEATLELPTEKTYALTIVPSNLRIF